MSSTLHAPRAALGPRFDLKLFHSEVLTHGALPLAVLRRVVDDRIDAGAIVRYACAVRPPQRRARREPWLPDDAFAER